MAANSRLDAHRPSTQGRDPISAIERLAERLGDAAADRKKVSVKARRDPRRFDGKDRADPVRGNLSLHYWRRYEAENYFVTPAVLRRYARETFADLELFAHFQPQIDSVLDTLVLARVFAGETDEFRVYREAPDDAARLIWEARTARLKLSDFAEEFFRELARQTGGRMLLTQGGLHELLAGVPPERLPSEVGAKLNALHQMFLAAAEAS